MNRESRRSIGIMFTSVALIAGTAFAGDDHTLPPSRTQVFPRPAPVVVFPPVDHKVLLKDDESRDPWLPYRFGIELPADLNPLNSGEWTNLGTERAWRLRIETDGAFSINLMFSAFKLAPGGRLYITNDAGRVLGPFTDRDNRPDGIFATRPLAGSATTLEYIEPNGKVHGVFNVSHVVHAYRDFFGYFAGTANASAPCHIDINCPVGQPYQNEKRAVMVLIAGGGGCTAELLNNTQLDGKQYFLTANHCFVGLGGPAGWVFTFNYEAPTCNGNPGTMSDSVTGATVLANSTISDFCVGKIDAPIAPWYNPYFLGWDVTGNPVQSSVAIHHPKLDIKKITLDNDPAAKVTAFQGSLAWQMLTLEGGAFEGGSSGSAMLDQNHHVVGQCIGGSVANCVPQETEWFGRFDVSWGIGVTPYLDPNGITTGTLDGIDGAGLLSVDLGALGASGQPTAEVGSLISITTDVASLGTYPPPTFAYQIRLSTDNVIDANDLVIDSGAESQYGPVVHDIQLPFTLAPGDYFLGLTVDPAQTEGNVLNNLVLGDPIKLVESTLPNLTAVAVGGPASADKGETIPVTFKVAGNAYAPTSYSVEVHLSSDEIISANDPMLGTLTINGLGDAQGNVKIPPLMPAGDWFLGLLVKPAVEEGYLDDNTLLGAVLTVTTPAVPPPDVHVDSVKGPKKSKVGKKAKLTIDIEKDTFAGKLPYTVRLSLDPEITQDDIVVGTFKAKKSGQQKIQPKVPSIAPGVYYWGVTIDGISNELELTNNSLAGGTVTIP